MFKSLTFRGFYSGFSRALFAAIFFMFCGIFVAGAYTVTYNCGSASGQPWTGSSDNPTPTQSAINCTTGGFLVGYCCQNGDDIHEVGPNQLIPNPSDDVTCKALWAQQRQLSFQYNIGNCSISDPTNLYGTSSSYSVPIQHIYTEHCMGVTENVSPNQLAILSPYNSGLNWSPQSSSNIFTSTEDLSNCVNFDYWKDFVNNTTYNCSTGSNGTCGTINVSGAEALFAHCNWTPYSVIYHGCDGTSAYTSPNTVIYGGSFNVLSYADTNLSSTGYTFQNWNTAADGSGTDYAPNASFTMNDCAVSGTTIDLYAKCECDNANNWWWNADNTACVRGYTIQLKILPEYATPEPTYPTAPTTLYTIPTRGAYLDAARTLLMTKTSNPIQLPYLEFMLNFDTNTPVNPVNNTQYSVPNVDSINMAGWYHCFAYPNMTGGIYAGHGWSSSTCFIHNTPNNYTNTSIRNLTPTNRDGYLTDQGIYEAENQYQNQTWYINGKGWEGSHYADNPTLTGYTFVNWCTDPENTTSCFKGRVPDNVQNHIYYAHWTPNTYDVVYNPGAHAASGSTSYTDTDGATYDSPYMPLSFGASPISDNMSAGTGYVFVGWTTDSTPTFTNGNLDNEYTGDTYWKRDSGLTLYAAYACDSENGYHLVNGECVLNTYTVTYYSGNCDPNNVENLFGNTYSATDSNLAVSGQPYNVLSYTNTSLVGDNFGQMYSDNGFGVPYACASFHGWNDPNIQGTDIDYNNCFSEQNGLCTPVIQSYSYEDNLNLYAYCKWDTWNVAYYGCDGELIKTESLKFGDSFLVPSASDISGYTFNGWIFKSGGNNINLGDTFPADLCLKGYNPLNLYADCTLNVYPVNLIWVANGESFPNQSTCDYGTGTISDISHPDLPGYRFTGWKVTNWE